MPPVLVFVLGLFCAFLWSSGAASSILNGVTQFLLDQSVKAGLVVENVSIQGRDKLSEAELREALGITKGTPIFAVDPEDARARVSSVGWVKTASVARELPNTIRVVIEERTPAALWQRDGVLTLIDADGHPITSTDVAGYSNLPQVVGKGAEFAAADLMKAVRSEPELASRIKAAVRVGERRWDIVFKGGVRARLPEQDLPGAWVRLAELERKHRLLEREIHIIDLRQPDRLVLRLTEPEVARRKESSDAKPKGARV
ncbi:cell division protein FtsQ/DivIB [Govanella unica]|uniref:Cell division protein FtsQ n=1 Tax=Govanella unica TaxID=2975056 RepID=A0A9X3U142_9PROT|nr:FtsQ-type POTRA domain-containing protein [Govania unica]MDA5195082.1 FtsQ-type POTRA domain-containing protein [Govania unica]